MLSVATWLVGGRTEEPFSAFDEHGKKGEGAILQMVLDSRIGARNCSGL